MTTYTRDEVLDKLIAAGLGDIEQHRITPDQYKRAMAGEVVIPQRPRAPASDGQVRTVSGRQRESSVDILPQVQRADQHRLSYLSR